MNTRLISETLSPVLDRPIIELESWLEQALARAMRDLVETGRIIFIGIGALEKEHVPPSVADAPNGEVQLLPPRNAVKFLAKGQSGEDALYRAALTDLGLEEDLASKFATGTAKTIKKLLETRGSVAFGDIGTFTRLADGTLFFKASEILLALLNRRYAALSPVLLPSIDEVGDAMTASQNSVSTVQASSSSISTAASVGSAGELISDAGNGGAKSSGTGSSQMPNDFFSPKSDTSSKAGMSDDAPSYTYNSQTTSSAAQSEAYSNTQLSGGALSSSPAAHRETEMPSMFKAAATGGASYSPMGNSEDDDPAESDKNRKQLITIVVSLMGVIVLALSFTLYNEFVKSKTPKPVADKSGTSSTEKKDPPKSDTGQRDVTSAEAKSAEVKPADANPVTAHSTDAKPSEVKPAEIKPAETRPSEPVKTELPKVEPPKVEPPKPSATAPSGTTPAVSGAASPAEKVDALKGGYCIVVGSGTSKAETAALVKQYEAKGFSTSTRTLEVGGTTRTRVRVGQYSKKEDAAQAIKDNAAKLPKGAFIDIIK